MSYKNRSALTSKKLEGPRASIVFNRMVVIDGRIEGTWQRTLSKDSVDVKIVPFAPLSKTNKQAVEFAIKRFQKFVNTDSAKKSTTKK
jgi:hypothetical protein